MMKKLFTASMLAFMAFGAFAEPGEIVFTYADGDLAAYGKARKETVDVAMGIDDPSLAGMKITKIDAYLNTDEVAGPSIWMSSALTLDKKVNVPDIFSVEVTPTLGEWDGYYLNMLSYTLEEPYTITTEPVYIGYTIKLTDVAQYGQKYPIIYCPTTEPNQNGFWLHTSSSVMQWMNYTGTDKAGGNVLIVLTIEGDFPAASLGFQSIDKAYVEDGKSFTANATVTNLGGSPVENIDYSYELKGVTKTGYCSFATPIVANPATSTIITLPFDAVEGIGSYPMTVTIDKVNGIPNESVTATATCQVNIVTTLPKKRPFVEEFTGTWCGYCPRGYIAMELLGELYGDDVVIACYHYGSGGSPDPMQVTNNFPVSVPGLPAASIDRVATIDPYYGTSSNTDFYIEQDFLNAAAQTTALGVDIESAVLVDDEISIVANITSAEDIENANYRLGFLLISNGLSGKTSSWNQTNYYANQKGYTGTPLEQAAEWPSSISGLVYNDVPVDATAMMGIRNSLPTTLNIGETYNVEYSYNIASNSVIQDRNNLVVAAFVIDGSNGRVVNANKLPVSNPAAVEGVYDDTTVVDTFFYDLNGRRISNPEKGIFVKVEMLSNGKTRNSKVMLK